MLTLHKYIQCAYMNSASAEELLFSSDREEVAVKSESGVMFSCLCLHLDVVQVDT